MSHYRTRARVMQRSTGLSYQKCLGIVEKNAARVSAEFPADISPHNGDIRVALAAGDIAMPAGDLRYYECTACGRGFLRTDGGGVCLVCLEKRA